MTALHLQTEIQRLLRREKNITVLEAIRMLLRREEARTDADDLSDEEVVELQGRVRDMVSGKIKPVGEKESIRIIRAAGKAQLKA
jgi:hypothetical protein